MQDRLYISQRVLFGLLLGVAGLYAGLLLMYSAGLAPVLDSLQGEEFLRLWQTHDYFLHIRIRFLLAAVGIMYVLTIGSMLILWRSKTFALIALAFLLSAAEVEVNRTLQRPVNRAIRLADVGTHSPSSVYEMERQLFHALHLRQMLAIGAFGVLCIAAMLPHAPRPRTRS